MPKELDLEALINEATAAPTGCASVQGEARRFLNAVRAKHQKGSRVIQSRAREILRREWDVRISEDALRNHLGGVCDCT